MMLAKDKNIQKFFLKNIDRLFVKNELFPTIGKYLKDHGKKKRIKYWD